LLEVIRFSFAENVQFMRAVHALMIAYSNLFDELFGVLARTVNDFALSFIP